MKNFISIPPVQPFTRELAVYLDGCVYDFCSLSEGYYGGSYVEINVEKLTAILDDYFYRHGNNNQE